MTLFLLITQLPFGFVALLGVIALSGIIIRNAVILLDQIDQDQRAGLSLWDAVIGATVRRFRPIMLTALTAILALIPLTQSTFRAPMAVALMESRTKPPFVAPVPCHYNPYPSAAAPAPRAGLPRTAHDPGSPG